MVKIHIENDLPIKTDGDFKTIHYISFNNL